MITRAKEVPVYRDIPHIAHTHTIPSRLVHCWPNRSLLRFPVTILLVRDLRASLVACYDRYEYDVDFSTYLRGNPWRKRYRKDIWRDFRFLNAWHRVQRRMPGRFHIVRYEDMQRDPQHELLRISSFLEWDISESMIADAVAASTKDKMASKEASTSHLPIVRKRKDHPFTWYTDEDRAFFMEATYTHLHNFFGYNYSNREIPAIVPIRHEDTSTAGSGSQAR